MLYRDRHPQGLPSRFKALGVVLPPEHAKRGYRLIVGPSEALVLDGTAPAQRLGLILPRWVEE